MQLGYTPLHQAAQQGHVLVINVLLKYKASPDTLTTVSEILVFFRIIYFQSCVFLVYLYTIVVYIWNTKIVFSFPHL